MLPIVVALVSACIAFAEPPTDAAIAAAADKLAAEALFSQSPGDPESAMTCVGKGEFKPLLCDMNVRLVFDLAGDKPAPTFVLHDGAAALTAKRK